MYLTRVDHNVKFVFLRVMLVNRCVWGPGAGMYRCVEGGGWVEGGGSREVEA